MTKNSSDISAVISPNNGVLKCSVDEIKMEVENHLLDTFIGTFEHTPVADSQENDHSYASGRPPTTVLDHSYSMDTCPRLTNRDTSGSIDGNPTSLLNRTFTTPEVTKVVKRLKNCKAAGWDRIPNEAIKNAPSQLLELITCLFNLVKQSGQVPDGWKRGRITLVYKSGLRELLSNYRPITVIISLCGLYSKVLNERLTEVVEGHKLLGEVQNGFRKERGGADNSFILDTVIWKARSTRKPIHLGFIDISKAYDTVRR